MATRPLAVIAIVTFLFTTTSAHAFLGSDDLNKQLEALEQQSGGDDDLGRLLNELEEATEMDSANFLQITNNGVATTISDVPKDQWFYPYVLALSEYGIVGGYKDEDGNLTGLFGPGNNVTRAEAIKIALNSAGVDTTSCGGFPTHPEAASHWARDFVACAESMDLGLKSTEGLNDPAPRAQALHFIIKAFGVEVPEGNPPFSDVPGTHPYADDIAFAYALEIVSGYGGDREGTFGPDDNITRAAFCKMAKLGIEVL